MPPWAALECERTGCTFDRIPTETPCSAAASAARCPASPAPMTSTSCWGKARASLWDRFQEPPSGARGVTPRAPWTGSPLAESGGQPHGALARTDDQRVAAAAEGAPSRQPADRSGCVDAAAADEAGSCAAAPGHVRADDLRLADQLAADLGCL